MHTMAPFEKRTAANRTNAKKSTGPHTASGKRNSSKSALTHGILSHHLVIDIENPKEYDALLNSLLDAHTPRDAAEQLLVKKTAVALWKMRRLNAVDLTIGALPSIDQCLIRYQAQLEGQYYRATATLLSLQTHREHKEAVDVTAKQQPALTGAASDADTIVAIGESNPI